MQRGALTVGHGGRDPNPNPDDRLVRRTTGRRFGWAALTATELKVAQLVADGHSNRSAAAALYVSPHTISSHLRSVFNKLDVNSRVQMTLLVIEHGQHQGALSTNSRD